MQLTVKFFRLTAAEATSTTEEILMPSQTDLRGDIVNVAPGVERTAAPKDSASDDSPLVYSEEDIGRTRDVADTM